ncbi:uncharacterized protein METZ01_LOCUS168854 [marine metagenome]|uniref:L,D-TPase catalytic domain-containing protein n=1 Tax=marine metagenome TaxID=408172 RepID=A0A382BQ89_9ZZZZ
MVLDEKLKTLTITEFNLIGNKDPNGSYDRRTRDNLDRIINKLSDNEKLLSPLERKLHYKFRNANFNALEKKAKKVRFEVARYRLSSNVKQTIKLISSAVGVLILTGFVIYEFFLDASTKEKVDVAYYAGLNKIGLVSNEGLDKIRQNLRVATSKLEKTNEENQQLNQMVEQMIHNNKVTENLKYILKQIYDDPKTKYLTTQKQSIIIYDGEEIKRYKTDPALWYVLGVVEKGVMRIFYADEEQLEIRAIFGRKGEETPIGDYEIKNRVYKPTWHKKEEKDGRARVRVIPFGDPDHEIGHWWLGLKKLGEPIPGSYGIHGVNASKVNEFYKKNFDWRNGSAGCPNIQEWYLHFLGKVLPLGTKVNIVSKDKWDKSLGVVQAASAA